MNNIVFSVIGIIKMFVETKQCCVSVKTLLVEIIIDRSNDVATMITMSCFCKDSSRRDHH